MKNTGMRHETSGWDETSGSRIKEIELREEHIRLTPKDRMRVKLAAQLSYLIFNCL